jgi:hypothetical protein
LLQAEAAGSRPNVTDHYYEEFGQIPNLLRVLRMALARITNKKKALNQP